MNTRDKERILKTVKEVRDKVNELDLEWAEVTKRTPKEFQTPALNIDEIRVRDFEEPELRENTLQIGWRYIRLVDAEDQDPLEIAMEIVKGIKGLDYPVDTDIVEWEINIGNSFHIGRVLTDLKVTEEDSWMFVEIKITDWAS